MILNRILLLLGLGIGLNPLGAQRSDSGMVRVPASSKEVVETETGIKILVQVPEFLISATEVTQADYERVTGQNPSAYRGARRPVENVSWWDAIRYCNLLSIAEKLEPCYDLTTGRCDRTRNGYRLPSDAEWEAAAAGSDLASSHLGLNSTKSAEDLARLVRETGTREVGTTKANPRGIYDMMGNVWEWTDDTFDPATNVPLEGTHGLMKIIRGGSFVSTRTQWARGYRSSVGPDHRGRYTGFRVVRTVSAKPGPPALDRAVFNQPPAGYETSTGGLTPLPTDQAGLAALREKWKRLLGRTQLTPHPPEVKLLSMHRERNYTGQLMLLRTEPDSWEKIYVMLPAGETKTPRPVIVVPYYDVDTPAGENLGGRSFSVGGVRAYAQLAVQRGFIAVAIRWFGESYAERYDEAVANLKLRHPEWTGLGKWVWDAQRLLDYIETRPEMDRTRIGIIGHSLGAKMALYAAAMDERIRSVVFSEGGIGFKMSNYDDYWYLGEALSKFPAGTDQHELIALIAPRPFLLIGGDEYDGPQSWHYINAARAVYRIQEKPENIGYFNHHKGHSPTPEAIWHAMRWLEQLW